MPKLNASMSDATFARMERLKTKTEAKSYADVINEALRLYEWHILQAEAGREFLTRLPGKEAEIVRVLT